MPAHLALSTLPSLDPVQAEHAARVLERLRSRIAAAGGWIPFDAFMQFALYEPGLGYYSAGAAKLGADGDFTTAPETSDLYGACIARQVAQILEALPGPGRDVLEIGAGSGRMAASVLAELARLGGLPDRYRILEVSADLRARQQALLAALPPPLGARVEWLDDWPPEPLRGVMLANEVLDALPCERFAWRAGRALALGVALDEHRQLVEVERPATPPLAAAVETIVGTARAPLPDGYRSEVCLRLRPWIAALAAALGSGVALLFDYGLPRSQLYLPERTDGTLMCHFRHRAHADALLHPGLQDITAWVDFTAVAEAASDAGLGVAGFVTQTALLLALGLEARIGAAPTDLERARLAAEARRLILPGEMGEAFKAIALTRGIELELAGFALQDLRRSL